MGIKEERREKRREIFTFPLELPVTILSPRLSNEATMLISDCRTYAMIG